MKTLNDHKQMTDVWKLPAIGRWEKTCGKHPTQKPLSLLSRIILASTKPSAWILDPFSGSGTTGIAASLLGRRFLGLEKEAVFLNQSKLRRQELECPDIKAHYLERLRRMNVIPHTYDFPYVAEEEDTYGLPW